MKLTIIAGGGINASTVSLNQERSSYRKPQGRRQQTNEDGWTERPNRNRNTNNNKQQSDVKGSSNNNSNAPRKASNNSNSATQPNNKSAPNNTNDSLFAGGKSIVTLAEAVEIPEIKDVSDAVSISAGDELPVIPAEVVALVPEIAAEPVPSEARTDNEATTSSTSTATTGASPTTTAPSTPSKAACPSKPDATHAQEAEKPVAALPTSPVQYSFDVEQVGSFSGMQTFLESDDGSLYLRLDPSQDWTKSILEKIHLIKHPKPEKTAIDAEPELLERVAVIEKMRQETNKAKKKKPVKKNISPTTQAAPPTSFAQMQVIKQKGTK